MTDPERTIAAQATAAGQGAIAVIRMSGPGCMDILKQCTPAAFTERLRPRRATLVCIRDAEGAAIDQALVTWFPAPASYTGEDTAEISCHGGMLVTDRLLKRLYRCGAFPAEPGEFTKRAFLNGRMDLTQAEAVMDVISAGSDLALKAAQSQLDGGIGSQVDELKETQAANLRINAGTSTLEAENARLGRDWRKTLRQRAREQKFAKELGVDLNPQATKPGTLNNARGNNAQNENEEDADE